MANEINTELLLQKDTRAGTALNYAFLRAKGIELLQQYSGNTWSDFNLHDPGVTILEYLCFGLTDLAYRTNFPIEDILTGKTGKINRKKNLFFTADEILTTNPVTINDFRRLIIDNVPELYNVWVEPVISDTRIQYTKGVYRVIMQLNAETIEQFKMETDKKKVQRIENSIIEKVKNIVHNSRNLGEDFEEFILLEPCEVEIQADINVDRNKFSEDVLAEIYAALNKALNPELKFYTEKELSLKGYPHEMIHEGPPLQHGFITEEELKPRTRFIDPADLLKAITEIEGVKLVQHLLLKVNNIEYDNRVCNLDENEFPYFVFNKEKPAIRLFNENYEIPVKQNLFFNLLSKKIDSAKRHYIKKPALPDDHFPIEGKYRNLQDYYSVQHLFPVIYKLNVHGIDSSYIANGIDNGTISDIAKAKQLKAFLMLFEQLMANYLSQLTNIDAIFSASVNDAMAHTYFFQPLYTVPGVENIINSFFNNDRMPTQAQWDKFIADQHNAYMNILRSGIETDDTYIKRKTRAIDHMLARFNCTPQKYPVEIFIQTYNWKSNHDRINTELLWKSSLLENVITLSRNRNLAFNYYKKNGIRQRAGFEERVARLLFIQDVTERVLGDVPENFDPAIKVNAVPGTPAETPGKTGQVKWENETFEIAEDENDTRSGEENDQDAAQHTGRRKSNTAFLKDALNENYYRIVPDNKSNGQQLIYRSPLDKYWQVIGKFKNRIAAGTALNKFISHLTKINIASEGFHVVEHVLLKPPLGSRFFGFNFFDEKGHLLCRQDDWLTFAEREKILTTICNTPKLPGVDNYSEVAKYLEELCDINMEHGSTGGNFVRPSVLYYSGKKDQVQKIFRRLIRNLKEFNQSGNLVFPKMQSVIRVTDDVIVPEDFFNFRITVVLPSWPARFQDAVFRTFTEKLFVKNSPAYMRFDFKWLDITEMKIFEKKYFQWREAMNTFKFSVQCIEDAGELISYLYSENKK